MARTFQDRYVYLLRCSDGSLYCGTAVDPPRRLKDHNGETPGDKGAKYTKSRRPCILVYTEGPYPYGEALSREAAIKKLSRKQKDLLLDNTKGGC